MHIHTLKIDLKGDVKQQLQDFIGSFDYDFSGQNGKEYLSREAVENGYESDVEYDFDIAYKKFNNMRDVVGYVMASLDNTYGSYGDISGYDVEQIDEDTLFVVFVYHYNE